ncbi:hypothetical protein BDQ17DRAFT_1415795, partial [Cyathus striatus]
MSAWERTKMPTWPTGGWGRDDATEKGRRGTRGQGIGHTHHASLERREEGIVTVGKEWESTEAALVLGLMLVGEDLKGGRREGKNGMHGQWRERTRRYEREEGEGGKGRAQDQRRN